MCWDVPISLSLSLSLSPLSLSNKSSPFIKNCEKCLIRGRKWIRVTQNRLRLFVWINNNMLLFGKQCSSGVFWMYHFLLLQNWTQYLHCKGNKNHKFKLVKRNRANWNYLSAKTALKRNKSSVVFWQCNVLWRNHLFWILGSFTVAWFEKCKSLLSNFIHFEFT